MESRLNQILPPDGRIKSHVLQQGVSEYLDARAADTVRHGQGSVPAGETVRRRRIGDARQALTGSTFVQSALADSGLFIGLFDADDKHHARCARVHRELSWKADHHVAGIDRGAGHTSRVSRPAADMDPPWRFVEPDPDRMHRSRRLAQAIELTESTRPADGFCRRVDLSTGVENRYHLGRFGRPPRTSVYRLPGKKSFTNPAVERPLLAGKMWIRGQLFLCRSNRKDRMNRCDTVVAPLVFGAAPLASFHHHSARERVQSRGD